MADKSSTLILDGLRRAAADPAGLPLHGNKTSPGLFAATAVARAAAEACKHSDYLRVIRTEKHGKTTHQVCALTEKGLSYLLDNLSPRQVLEDMVRALDARRNEVNVLTTAVQQMAGSLGAFQAIAVKVMDATAPKPDANTTYSQWMGTAKPNGTVPELAPSILAVLDDWHAASSAEDCALPELYGRVKSTASLSIGQFHDALRSLYEQARIYLHPWTGPLYEIPDPSLVLMVGHEIAYYASKRS